MSRKHTEIRNKTVSVIAVVSIILLLMSLLIPFTQASTPDYSNSWAIPADGSKDSSQYYQITRHNTSNPANITVKAWTSNTTVLTVFDNIKSVKLFLNATDVSLSDYQSALSLMGSIDIILKSNTPKVNFSFSGIPKFRTALLDNTEFTNYDYYSSNNTLSFSINMSTHIVTLQYGYLGDLVTIVVGVSTMVFIVKQLKFNKGDWK